jgi:biopolymer transport protein ExbD
VERRGMKKHMDSRSPSSFKIQITSMVDMFIILLVFLLKSYSTSPVNITPNANLRLPQSVTSTDPVDVLKLVVSKQAIFVDDNKVVDIANNEIDKTQVDAADPQFIRPLYEELDKKAQKSKDLAKVNDTVEFDGKVMMQVDRDLPYSVLKKIMYTSMLAGYYDVKFAVVSKD